MQRKPLAVIVGAVVAAVVLAAIAFGPPGIEQLANPPETPDEPRDDDTVPNPSSFSVPTWRVGDRWTYETRGASGQMAPAGLSVSGILSRTVVSADASMYNVSVEGLFRSQWVISPATQGEGFGPMTEDSPLVFRDATLAGFTWYRTSDLAILREFRTVTFERTAPSDAGMYRATYTASVDTKYEPPLDVWSFPLVPNDAWVATGEATVVGTSRWTTEDPSGLRSGANEWTFKRPVHLGLASGPVEDVVTPAGTFPAIAVRIDVPETGIDAGSTDVAAGLDRAVPVPLDPSLTAWFSGTAKNVVQLSLTAGDARADLVLTDYDLG